MTTVSSGFWGLLDPTLTFAFDSTPQEALNNRTFIVRGGMILGGSSGVNGMQVVRGQREDYDRWGQYFGRNSGWSWNSLLPYFRKVSLILD